VTTVLDEAAFRKLADAHARELHLHCYRMLGSFHDAEDALQETFLRAWRHIETFEERSSLRAWLYRIATNVCLRAAERRRPLAQGELVQAPYPESLLDGLPDDVAGPEARYDLRESVNLAFLAAVQTLTPRQRAVLLLREVLGWSAREVADLLETSTASVNSALQRARATLDERRAQGRLGFAAPTDEEEQSIVRRYVEAWDAVDIDGLVRLLKEDAIMTMPPFPQVYVGARTIGAFFATEPEGGRLDRIRLVPTRANRQPAVAAYVLDDEAGVYRAYGVMVLTLDGPLIAEIVGFADAGHFPTLDLPTELTPEV
jgi:RNA polymerase sigma-70 factor (ECF subfamily)